MLWMFPAVIKVYCTLDVQHFPFDNQHCPVVFISWTFHGCKLNLTYNESEPQVIYYTPRNQVSTSIIMPPPRRGAGALGSHRRSSSVRPSVCLSDVAYIGSNSKTKRPRKTKLYTWVPQVTCDSHTDFKVKRSKVKVTGRGHIVAAT